MFKKLKGLMWANDIRQHSLAEHLNVSKSYISQRLVGKYPFSMNDVYIICKLLEIPHEKIAEYFPQNGR